MKLIFTRQAIEDGMPFPAHYGYAWHDYDRDVTIMYPIPLNIVFAWFRALWLTTQVPRYLRDSLNAEGLNAEAFARGYHAGKQVSNNYDRGHILGLAIGRNEGHRDGIKIGAEQGYAHGFQNGVNQVVDEIDQRISKMAK